jgi:hypothetical protein
MNDNNEATRIVYETIFKPAYEKKDYTTIIMLSISNPHLKNYMTKEETRGLLSFYEQSLNLVSKSKEGDENSKKETLEMNMKITLETIVKEQIK